MLNSGTMPEHIYIRNIFQIATLCLLYVDIDVSHVFHVSVVHYSERTQTSVYQTPQLESQKHRVASQ